MRKLLFLIFAFLFAGNSYAQGTIIVDKILLEDETWNMEGSPYIIEHLQIDEGVTLTIDEGVEVISGDPYQNGDKDLNRSFYDNPVIEVWGSIQFRGSNENPIFIDRITIRMDDNDNGSGVVSLDNVNARHFVVDDNYTDHSITVKNSNLYRSYLELRTYYLSEIYSRGGPHKIENSNLIGSDIVIGVAYGSDDAPSTNIINSTFMESDIIFESWNTENMNLVSINNNNLLSGVLNVLPGDDDRLLIDASGNYWGMIHNIEDRILDRNDDLNKPHTVNFDNYLSGYSVQATPPMVSNLTISKSDGNINLDWSDVQVSDLVGYKVYWSEKDNNVFSYENVSPIVNESSFVFDNVEGKTVYHFIVTAVDLDGNESWYNEKSIPIGFPALTLLPTSLHFDSTLYGNKKTKSFNIVNTGDVDLEISNIEVISSTFDNAFSVEETSNLLSPGDNWSVNVQFTPELDQSYSYIIRIHSNSYDEKIKEMPVTGVGVRTHIEIHEPSIYFRNVEVGKNKTAEVEFYNPEWTGSSIEITDIKIQNNSFSVDDTSTSIQPGQSWIANFTFNPIDTISVVDTAYVYLNKVDSLRKIVLMGQGVQAQIVVGDTLNFSNTPVGNISSLNFRIETAEEDLPLHIDSFKLTSNAFHFDGNPDFNLPIELNWPGEWSWNILFAPVDTGLVVDTLTVYSNAVDSMKSIILRGRGIGVGSMVLLNGKIKFDDVVVYETDTLTIGFRNDMLNNGYISDIYSTYEAFYPINPSLYDVIEPGNSVDIPIVFSPSNKGSYRDTLNILVESELVDSLYTVEMTGEAISSVSAGAEIISHDFALNQNYPNPFNPNTTIEYILPEPSSVNLTVVNVMGQVVRAVEDSRKSAGTHQVNLNMSDLPSGTYFYRLQAGEFSDTKQMVLVK